MYVLCCLQLHWLAFHYIVLYWSVVYCTALHCSMRWRSHVLGSAAVVPVPENNVQVAELRTGRSIAIITWR